MLFLGPAVLLIGKALLQSWLHDDWPFACCGGWPLVHGPWHFTFVLARPWADDLANGILLVFAAVLVSGLVLIIKCDRRALWFFLASGVSLWLSMRHLFWLID